MNDEFFTLELNGKFWDGGAFTVTKIEDASRFDTEVEASDYILDCGLGHVKGAQVVSVYLDGGF